MLQQASILNLVKILVFFILILYGFRVLVRYILPWFLRNAIKKAQQRAGYQQENYKKQKEGETSIHKKPYKTTKKNHNVGQYVDYEEVE